jgi:hypothetical protein
MDEKTHEDQDLAKVDEVEIEPLSDEALENVAGGTTAGTFQPATGDSCTDCCSCSSCS